MRPVNETGDGKSGTADGERLFAGISDRPSTVAVYDAPRGFLSTDTENSIVSAVLSRNEAVSWFIMTDEIVDARYLC